METETTSVLIVGGSLVGLSAAIFLADRGVATVLVERHPGSSPHPRALGFTTRTAELYRSVGLGGLPQVPPGMGRPGRVPVESLAGKWGKPLLWSADPVAANEGPPSAARKIDYSPCSGIGLGQDKLEPFLRERAIELGADLRLGSKMISFSQDHDSVTAVILGKDDGEYRLRADYMIAADGNASTIRETLGIGRDGLGYLATLRSVLFRAPKFLETYLDSGFSQFVFDTPEIKGTLVSYRDTRWALMLEDDLERDEATQIDLVVKAIGHPDVGADDIEILAHGRWVLNALIADKFREGRVFLAGDAAHALPPARGGYGANTGIDDAHNLAWKLAAVLSGASTPALLDTYDAERRPIAWLRHGQIFNRQDYASVARPADKEVAIISDEAMELGQLYRSAAVLGANLDLPPALKPDQWAGQPGTRAPHLWVNSAGERTSTLDLFGRDWTLVTQDPRWRTAADAAAKALGVKVQTVIFAGAAKTGEVGPPPGEESRLSIDSAIEQIVAKVEGKAVLDSVFPGLTGHSAYDRFKVMSLRQLQPMSQGLITDEGLAKSQAALEQIACEPPPADPDPPGNFLKAFRAAFGLGPTGAALVRPDGYVGWRTVEAPDDPAQALTQALGQVASSPAI